MALSISFERVADIGCKPLESGITLKLGENSVAIIENRQNDLTASLLSCNGDAASFSIERILDEFRYSLSGIVLAVGYEADQVKRIVRFETKLASSICPSRAFLSFLHAEGTFSSR